MELEKSSRISCSRESSSCKYIPPIWGHLTGGLFTSGMFASGSSWFIIHAWSSLSVVFGESLAASIEASRSGLSSSGRSLPGFLGPFSRGLLASCDFRLADNVSFPFIPLILSACALEMTIDKDSFARVRRATPPVDRLHVPGWLPTLGRPPTCIAAWVCLRGAWICSLD